MKISLLTDAPKHNLALMKISAWHKKQGDEVLLNMPLFPADYTYASVLFEKNIKLFNANEYGGPAYEIQDGKGWVSGDGLAGSVERWGMARSDRRGISRIYKKLLQKMHDKIPDYSLFGLDYSLGYTFRSCLRSCKFCKVHLIENDMQHHSIWEFHDPKFKKICLLNNNTFFDKQWKETFEEIWDANLSVIDENGYDLRLLDDEKADALHKTKWATPLHFAWDNIEDEDKIITGLKLLEKHHLRSTSNGVYVLIGFNTTEEEDLHRCQIIDDYGLTPYPMPFKKTKKLMKFKRFINLHYYRKYKTIKEAWEAYR